MSFDRQISIAFHTYSDGVKTQPREWCGDNISEDKNGESAKKLGNLSELEIVGSRD
jgi:hypothetical protein